MHVISTVYCSEKIKPCVKKVRVREGEEGWILELQEREKRVSSCIGAYCSFRHSSNFLSSCNISQY